MKLDTLNIALVNASRSAGIGHEPTDRLCAFLNMRSPPSNWITHQSVLRDAYQLEADKSMKRAIEQAQQASDDPGLTASLDGSWMKRGYQSMMGLVSAISLHNKVIGVDVTSKYCATCKGKAPCTKGDNCSINYRGSSGGMESVSATNIIKRIHQTTGVKVTTYLGDGDSKGFVRAKQAVDWPMTKLECVNHVAKRMGTRLRALCKKFKLGGQGKGKLTGQAIDRIQKFYNQTVHYSNGDVSIMKQKIDAMRKHIGSSDADPDHDDCDPSVCKYLKAYVIGEGEYDHDDHFHISKDIMDKVGQVFDDLTDQALLEKITHGKTQNSNESFNSTVWNLLPKSGFANRQLVEWAVFKSVCKFNEGELSVVRILHNLGAPIGYRMVSKCQSTDHRRMYTKRLAEECELKRQKRVRDTDDGEYDPGNCPYE